MSEFTRTDAAGIIKEHGLVYSKEGFDLKNGRSNWYCDVKAAFANGSDLSNLARLVIELATDELGISFNTVGGPEMGANAFVHACALEGGFSWFLVRKEIEDELAAQSRPPKSPPRFPPGTPQEYFWIEGTQPSPGSRVLWLEDAISTSGSMFAAMERFNQHPTARHAQIVGAMAIVDRDIVASHIFAERNIPYASVISYRELGIPALSEEQF